MNTTGLLGWSNGEAQAFPDWAIIPSHHDLATGRVVHFFFAWAFVGVLLVVAFVVVHVLMVLAAGPIKELRSITTGW